jgi:hypothetical protein
MSVFRDCNPLHCDSLFPEKGLWCTHNCFNHYERNHSPLNLSKIITSTSAVRYPLSKMLRSEKISDIFGLYNTYTVQLYHV